MASLRARLVAGLLALSAVGLLVLAGITYVEQRSFFIGRADQQVRAAPGAIARALDDHDFGFGGDSRDGRPRGGDPDVGLPPGTYGVRRNADGSVSKPVVLDYGQNVTSKPAIPARLEPGRIITVSGRAGDDTRYRVLASPDREGSGVIVAAVPLREVDQNLNRLLAVEALVIAGVLVGLGLVARLVVRVGLLPLDRMAHTAGAIAGGDISHRVPSTDPRTEVGRLGRALNAMLDRLEHAFAERRASEERLRQFIADASHELRTPLTTIRGYAELYRIGAARDPEETERAMRRIEDEAARMGVLVEDLLTLARLDEVRAAPHVEVDLGALAGDAVEDARATAPERPIELAVTPPATVLGDADQLRQVLGNLVRNALVHTPAGTGIEIALGPSDGRVELKVRDHGAGLPMEDSDALFGRFWRAERGRERGRGGAGLGLAIVAAIVDAHGGTASAANAPGGGAAFVVRLPAA
jgi:two-component system OmpR family sensor kinase